MRDRLNRPHPHQQSGRCKRLRLGGRNDDITAVGGGVLRDVLLNRIPVILEKEIYASAALAGASIVVAGKYLNLLPADRASTCKVGDVTRLRHYWVISPE